MLFFLEWLFLLIAVPMFLLSCFFIDSRKYGWSLTFMLGSFVLLGWFYHTDLFQLFRDYGLIRGVLYLVGWYLVAGLATAFIYFASYSRSSGERYHAFLEAADARAMARSLGQVVSGGSNDNALLEAYTKYNVVRTKIKDILNDPRGVLKLPDLDVDSAKVTTYPDATAHFLEIVASVLPPRFKVCRKFIVWAAVQWPVTLFQLALYKIVIQVLNALIDALKGVFDVVSKLAFGKI